jgi:hypothetical protein
MTSKHAIREHLYKTNMLATGPGARVFKKIFFEQMGGYPILYGPANDTYFNIRTTSVSPILCLPYTYLNYRRHEGQEINNQFAYLYQGYLYFRDAILIPELPINIKEKSFFLKGEDIILQKKFWEIYNKNFNLKYFKYIEYYEKDFNLENHKITAIISPNFLRKNINQLI